MTGAKQEIIIETCSYSSLIKSFKKYIKKGTTIYIRIN